MRNLATAVGSVKHHARARRRQPRLEAETLGVAEDVPFDGEFFAGANDPQVFVRALRRISHLSQEGDAKRSGPGLQRSFGWWSIVTVRQHSKPPLFGKNRGRELLGAGRRKQHLFGAL